MKESRVGLYWVRYLLLWLLLFMTVPVVAQPNKSRSPLPKVDSLIGELHRVGEDTLRVALLNDLSSSYTRSNPLEGIRYAQQSLELAQKLGWTKGIAKAYYNLGKSKLIMADYRAALEDLQASLKLEVSGKNTAAMIETYFAIGDIFIKLSKYPQASEYYFKALKIAESEHRADDIATCYIYIGDLFRASGDYDKALAYFLKGVDNCKATGNSIGLAVSLRNIGNVYYVQGSADKAWENYNQALNVARMSNDKRNIAENLANISIIYSDKGENEKALDHAFSALEIYRAIGDQSGIANILGNIGTTFLITATIPGSIKPGKHVPASKAANLNNAIGYLQRAVALEKDLGELTAIPQFYENLSEAYSLQGNYKKAYEAHTDFVTYKDSAESLQRSKEIATINMEYEFAKQKDSIKMQKILTEQRLTVEQILRKREKIYYLSGLVVLLLVAVFIFRGLRTQQKLNQTITRLVTEQEITIEQRTADLRITNEKLRDLISFNAHQIREPLTRITGTLSIRDDVEQDEFMTDFVPLMEKAARDLDNAIKDVLEKAQKNEIS